MDFNTLKDQVSNLTLYDLKAGVRKVQNAVMNYTEMEAKVREATNNEPWGASSTTMQEIANGTHSYQLLNEIMPMIYKRFTDKSAEEWRQIYKALQLLEFLIKNGSERVIDDARSHLSLLRMLRQFHYIDQNGKDQGVNVRNRAQELAKMLGDVDTIRAERKKARSNRNKFGGVEGGMGMSGGFSTGSRYGGFGSEEPQGNYGGYSGGVYGDGGGFGGATSEFQDSGRKGDRFEEYDEYDEGAVAAPGRRKSDVRAGTATSTARREKKTETPKKKEPEPDLLFDDDPVQTSTSTSNGKQPASNDSFAADDDDFDDFQSAASPAAPIPPPSALSSVLPPPVSTTTSHTQFAAPQPVSTAQPDLNSLAGFQSVSPAPSSTSTSTFSSPPVLQQQPAPMQTQPQIQKPTTYQPKGPNYFTSVQSPQPSTTSTTNTTPSFNKPSPSPFGGNKSSTASKPASADAFNSLWSTASATAGIKTTTGSGAGAPKLADMAKQKSSAGIWGTSTPPPGNQGGMAGRPVGNVAAPAQGQQQQQQQYGGGLNDLLG